MSKTMSYTKKGNTFTTNQLPSRSMLRAAFKECYGLASGPSKLFFMDSEGDLIFQFDLVWESLKGYSVQCLEPGPRFYSMKADDVGPRTVAVRKIAGFRSKTQQITTLLEAIHGVIAMCMAYKYTEPRQDTTAQPQVITTIEPQEELEEHTKPVELSGGYVCHVCGKAEAEEKDRACRFCQAEWALIVRTAAQAFASGKAYRSKGITWHQKAGAKELEALVMTNAGPVLLRIEPCFRMIARTVDNQRRSDAVRIGVMSTAAQLVRDAGALFAGGSDDNG